jgi:hypothetical protein
MKPLSSLTDHELANYIEHLETKSARARLCGRIKKAKHLSDELIAARVERMRRGAKRRAA